ncbi:MAG TPA: chemotaxis response regulator protein-glutamate methylesterase [Terriglobia bacterium]|nr:chemotaxis response regulator protein-glutamate methylesterase [Terriglobia bacterium]
MDRILRVLVVDDSAYVRKVIRQMLGRSPFIEVVGAARDGEEALTLVRELHPDVVTLDLIMPGMGGLGFIKEQMSRAPMPIIVVSIANETSQLVLDALDSGAIDFVQKPSALATEKVFEMSDDLIEKVKAAGNVRLTAMKDAPVKAAVKSQSRSRPKSTSTDIIVIGISTGGPQALKYLVPRLPRDFPLPIAIVLHMPVGYTELYAKRLNELSELEVSEAQEGDEVRNGRVLIAPAGRHLTFVRTDSKVITHLDARPFDMLHRPSVDVLFRSAADTFGRGVLGVVMTGMGEDGKDGSSWIKSKGGMVFAEAEESCVVFGMPRAVIEAGLVNRTIPLERMSDALLEAAYGESTDRR